MNLSGHGERVSRRAHTPETGRFDSGARYHFRRDIFARAPQILPAINHSILIRSSMPAVSLVSVNVE